MKLDEFRNYFNHIRPHEALKQIPPGTIYKRSPRIWNGKLKSPEYPKEYWETKIQEWLSSGKSAKAWCQENRVVYNTFLGWLNRFKSNEPRKSIISSSQNSTISSPTSSAVAHFIELKDDPKVNPGITLECEGVQIHLTVEFNPATLKKCLNVLRGTLC